jgi:DNA-binding Lrp family transcriptional regulator
MQALDDLDRRLIASLREDGRAPMSRLASRLSVTRNTIENRLQRLIDSGTVLGFTIRVHDQRDERAVRAIMLIQIAGRSTTAAVRSLRGVPELHALHTTNGAWDLVAEIRTASLAEFDRVLRQVREMDGITNSETSLLLSSI